MLKILQSIFGGDESTGRYTETLVEQAIERAVNGVYPKLRALPDYRQRLRAPVVKAIDYVITLVDGLAPPIPADGGHYLAQPALAALFVSPEHVRQVLGNDPALAEFRAEQPAAAPVTALLLAECQERQTFGMALAGDLLHRDVAQTTVSFAQHRLLDPAASETEARRLLKRRAFDHLLSLALWRLGEARGEYAELQQQRDLLRCKLGILQRGGWSFDAAPAADAALQAELAQVEAQLDGLRIDEHSLDGQLDLLAEVLADAGRQLWMQPLELHLDRMNVKCPATAPDARAIRLDELHNARGERLAARLLGVDPRQLPARPTLTEQANRLLAELGPAFRR